MAVHNLSVSLLSHTAAHASQRRSWLASLTIARALALSAAVLLLSAPPVTSQDIGSPVLFEGDTCYLTPALVPAGKPCGSSPYHCVVTTVPPVEAVDNRLVGICNSSYSSGHYCIYTSQPYAISTAGIRASPECEECTCVVDPSIDSTNQATCRCSTVGPCYVNSVGQPVTSFTCPERQSRCLITSVGTGPVAADGRRTDTGTCVWKGFAPYCAVAGPNWGPKFFAAGTKGVWLDGNRCTICTCGDDGKLKDCKPNPECVEGGLLP